MIHYVVDCHCVTHPLLVQLFVVWEVKWVPIELIRKGTAQTDLRPSLAAIQSQDWWYAKIITGKQLMLVRRILQGLRSEWETLMCFFLFEITYLYGTACGTWDTLSAWSLYHIIHIYTAAHLNVYLYVCWMHWSVWMSSHRLYTGRASRWCGFWCALPVLVVSWELFYISHIWMEVF